MVPPPDRRATFITVLCWTVILAVVAALAVRHDRSDRAVAARAPTSTATGGPGMDLSLTGRVAVAAKDRGAMGDALRQQVRTALGRSAVRPVDRLAAVVITRELDGPAAAVAQLDHDEPNAAASPELSADWAALRSEYVADSPTALTDAQRAGLAHDLGYFGRLAAAQGHGADPAERRAVLADAGRTMVAVTLLTVLLAGGLVVGFIGLIVMAVLFGTGVLRFAYRPVDPTPSTVWLETFTVWMVAFVGFSVVVGRLHLPLPIVGTETVAAVLTAAVAVGWPVARGRLAWGDVRRSLGWTAGRNGFLEVALGLAGYVAGLPVVAVGIGATLVLAKLAKVRPSHPIEQEFGGEMSGGHVLGLLVAAAVLAPLLEETMFRGALYAQLRRRHAAWVSATVVALLFAAVHPQGWAAIPALGSIALVLAFLREWRGTLLAPIAAHALNNGVLVAVLSLALG